MRKFIAIVLAVLQFAFCAFVAGKNVLDQKRYREKVNAAVDHGDVILLHLAGFQIRQTSDRVWYLSACTVYGYDRYYVPSESIGLSPDENGRYMIDPDTGSAALTVVSEAFDNACYKEYPLDGAFADDWFGADRAMFGPSANDEWFRWYDFTWDYNISGRSPEITIRAAVYEGEIYFLELLMDEQSAPLDSSIL